MKEVIRDPIESYCFKRKTVPRFPTLLSIATFHERFYSQAHTIYLNATPKMG